MPLTPATMPRQTDADWLAVLRALAGEIGIAAAAARIGMARPSVSLVLADRYPGGTAKVEQRVRRHLMNQVSCPAMGEDIPLTRCTTLAARPFSAASARAARFWRTCQSCPYRPQPGDASNAV